MKIHIVKKGDSLYEIAQKYHVELDKLIAANPHIPDPNVLDIGTKVKIPASPKSITPPTDYLYKHIAVQGDSLWKLGKAWGIPLADMIAANPQLKNPNVLMTGEAIYIPKLSAAPSQKLSTGVKPKADTSQIIPEAPLPVEEPPAAEQEAEKPSIEIQHEPSKEQPNVLQAEKTPEQPNVEIQQQPSKEQPSVPHIQSVPQWPNVGILQEPSKEQPNIQHIQSVPQIPNVGIQQEPTKEQPSVPHIQSVPQWPNVGILQEPSKEQPNIQYIQSIPQWPNVGIQQEPSKEQPNVPHIQSIPQWPNVGIQQVPSYEQPNVPYLQAIPQWPNVGIQQVPSYEQPNVPYLQAIPQWPNVGIQQVSSYEQPNVPYIQPAPQWPNVGIQQEPSKEQPNVPYIQSAPQWPNVGIQQESSKEQPNVPYIQSAPQWPNVGIQQEPSKEQPNVSPFDAIPQIPYLGVQQAPAIELSNISPSYGVPQWPNTAHALTAVESNEPFGLHEAVLPHYTVPQSDWQTGIHSGAVNLPPSSDLFQQYHVPATEVMAHDTESSKSKGKEEEWKQPEHLPLPPVHTMPTAESLPALPNLPSSAEIPYYTPHAPLPSFPYVEGPHLGGGCGCGKGQPQLPYALPLAAGYPGIPTAGDPFLSYPIHPYGVPIAPYGTGGYSSFEPLAAVNAYPGISPYADTAGPGSPLNVPYPWGGQDWGGQEAYGYHDQSKGDKEKSREEKAEVSQTGPQPVPRQSKASAKRKSPRVSISSLIKRHNRRTRKTETVRKASPWINN
ncbi:LysM peptidoglycan-binding domain-containing protein [Paenibacillus naphthalenovorans]|uniref:LysM peptidoglycan-binding domain-containing protein n=1 Tax=Paenibacillus naphthalenovorans TaxID=162209 RepID=UPI003D2AFE4E